MDYAKTAQDVYEEVRSYQERACSKRSHLISLAEQVIENMDVKGLGYSVDAEGNVTFEYEADPNRDEKGNWIGAVSNENGWTP